MTVEDSLAKLALKDSIKMRKFSYLEPETTVAKRSGLKVETRRRLEWRNQERDSQNLPVDNSSNCGREDVTDPRTLGGMESVPDPPRYTSLAIAVSSIPGTYICRNKIENVSRSYEIRLRVRKA